MIILFTGHRDRIADEGFLVSVYEVYPGAIWLHGGAAGFDSQVERFAITHGINMIKLLPDFDKHGKEAPLRRNDRMIEMCDIVIALYDERGRGGTFYTINHAIKAGKNVIYARFAPGVLS